MIDMNSTDLPIIGTHVSVQVPGGRIQLAKMVDNRLCKRTGIWYTLVRWVDIIRDAEWIPSRFIPPKKDF